MHVFNWIMGMLVAVCAVGAAGCLLVFLLFDIEVWLVRARTLRRGLYMALLLWFNGWVWGRVVWTLFHW